MTVDISDYGFSRRLSTKERAFWTHIPVAERPLSGKYYIPNYTTGKYANGRQFTASEGHLYDRYKGHRVGGGPFYTSRIVPFQKPIHITNAADKSFAPQYCYSGRAIGSIPSSSPEFGNPNTSSMKSDGTFAISQANPVNPNSHLAQGILETWHEGLPSIPGIKAWERRAQILLGAGDEFLNYIFGWAPLVKEIHDVRDSVRESVALMRNYKEGEHKELHREFNFPLRKETSIISDSMTGTVLFPNNTINVVSGFPQRVVVSHSQETKKRFVGCFSYASPADSDNLSKLLGVGSKADQLYGIALTPELLWELTPWSWAVDWFSNVGDVVTNYTNFGLAGLSMRFGYMMEETIDIYKAEGSGGKYWRVDPVGSKFSGNPYQADIPETWSHGYEIVTKRRIPASPFGFSVAWEGLSPIQLAITAALGITKLL